MVKRENQRDAANLMFIIKLSISTWFGHQYTNHQENKTVSYCMWCSVWLCRLWLAVVLWSCVVSCVHCVHAVGLGLILLMMGIMMPETCWDRKLDNKHRISCIVLVRSLHLMFTMRGHKILKSAVSFHSQTNVSEIKKIINIFIWQ